MKKVSIISILCMCIAHFSFSQNEANTTPAPESYLQGEWVIDLRPSPEAAPYLKEMKIIFNDGKRFAGSFYDTPFENGVINTTGGETYFAFSTKDGRATYFTSGKIENGELKGLTYCDNRDFVMPWTGKRKDEITN